MVKYGTPLEKIERALIEKYAKKLRQSVVCPNEVFKGRAEHDFSIKPFLGIVSDCTQVVATEIDGHASKGVFTEVSFALLHRKPVWCLRANHLWRVVGVEVYIRDSDDRRRYGRLIVDQIAGFMEIP